MFDFPPPAIQGSDCSSGVLYQLEKRDHEPNQYHQIFVVNIVIFESKKSLCMATEQ